MLTCEAGTANRTLFLPKAMSLNLWARRRTCHC